MKKLICIIFLFFLTNCGFEPIYIEKNSSSLVVKSFSLSGDKKINKKISRFLSLKIDENNALAYDLKLNSKKIIISVAKDSTGNNTKYKTTLSVNLLLKGINNIERSKQFSRSFTYNDRDNKFDLLQYQKNVEDNLINKITEEIKIFLDSKNDN